MEECLGSVIWSPLLFYIESDGWFFYNHRYGLPIQLFLFYISDICDIYIYIYLTWSIW